MAIVKPVIPPRTTDPQELERWFSIMAERQSYLTYAGVPTGTVIPRWIGDWCLDSDNADWYLSTGVTVADWKAVT